MSHRVNERLLNGQELARYKRLEHAAQTADVSDLRRTLRPRFKARVYLPLVVWAAASLGSFALLMAADQANKTPEAGMSAAEVLAGVVCLVVTFGGLVLVVRQAVISGSATEEEKSALWRRVEEFLSSIGYADRLAPLGGSYDSSSSRSYPVTGHYDPALYRERGGSATRARMEAVGISDYETYRSNVEEAE